MRTACLLVALTSWTACGAAVSTPDGSPRDGAASLMDAALPESSVDDEGRAPPDASLIGTSDGGSHVDGPACGEDGGCAVGSVCAQSLCVPCGEPGMACCAGGACDPPANACLDGVCTPMR
jgi:hypothetical protein